MGQYAKSAAMMDAQIMHRREESVGNMGQYAFLRNVAMMDAQVMHRKEESA